MLAPQEGYRTSWRACDSSENVPTYGTCNSDWRVQWRRENPLLNHRGHLKPTCDDASKPLF